MKKKIILFIFIISLFILILSLSVFADQLLPLGTEIVFNNAVNFGTYNPATKIQLPFTCNDTRYNYIQWSQYSQGVPYLTYNPTVTTSGLISVYRNGWLGDYKTIIVAEDFEINDNDYLLISNNATINIPEPPPEPSPMDTVYDDGQTFLSNTTTNLNTILSFIVTNPVITIFTIGIFIISITVGILYRLNNKTTRKKS